VADHVTTLPFKRGQTLHGGNTNNVASDVEQEYLGIEVEDVDTVHGTNRIVTFVVAKNKAGSTVAAKRTVPWKLAANQRGRSFGSYTTGIAAAVAGVVDPELGSTGCVAKDVCLIQTQGPCDVVMGDIASAVVFGDLIVTDDDSDGGKVGEAASAAAYIANPVGTADEAASSTDAEFRVILDCRR